MDLKIKQWIIDKGSNKRRRPNNCFKRKADTGWVQKQPPKINQEDFFKNFVSTIPVSIRKKPPKQLRGVERELVAEEIKLLVREGVKYRELLTLYNMSHRTAWNFANGLAT